MKTPIYIILTFTILLIGCQNAESGEEGTDENLSMNEFSTIDSISTTPVFENNEIIQLELKKLNYEKDFVKERDMHTLTRIDITVFDYDSVYVFNWKYGPSTYVNFPEETISAMGRGMVKYLNGFNGMEINVKVAKDFSYIQFLNGDKLKQEFYSREEKRLRNLGKSEDKIEELKVRLRDEIINPKLVIMHYFPEVMMFTDLLGLTVYSQEPVQTEILRVIKINPQAYYKYIRTIKIDDSTNETAIVIANDTLLNDVGLSKFDVQMSFPTATLNMEYDMKSNRVNSISEEKVQIKDLNGKKMVNYRELRLRK